MSDLIYEEESYVVKGAVFEVYKTMGVEIKRIAL